MRVGWSCHAVDIGSTRSRASPAASRNTLRTTERPSMVQKYVPVETAPYEPSASAVMRNGSPPTPTTTATTSVASPSSVAVTPVVRSMAPRRPSASTTRTFHPGSFSNADGTTYAAAAAAADRRPPGPAFAMVTSTVLELAAGIVVLVAADPDDDVSSRPWKIDNAAAPPTAATTTITIAGPALRAEREPAIRRRGRPRLARPGVGRPRAALGNG